MREKALNQNYTQATAKRYGRSVRLLLNALGNKEAVEQASFREITDYLHSLRKEKLSSEHIRTELAGIKALYSYLVKTGKRMDNPTLNLYINNTKGKPKHIILLHGFEASLFQGKGSEQLDNFYKELVNTGQVRDWNVWNLDYTSMLSFRDCAWKLVQNMKAKGFDYSNTLMLGYSMGGVVARQMISFGFPCLALITMCSPHQGVMDQIKLISKGLPGPMSLYPESVELARLNQDPVDKRNRSIYYAFGVTFKDSFGVHDDDHVVPTNSALGANLGRFAGRNKVMVEYKGMLGGAPMFDPHLAMLDKDYFQQPLKLLLQMARKVH